jgi:hypothetical protein
MKNRPLLLIFVCVGLGGLVWLDNRTTKTPERQTAASAAALEVDQHSPDQQSIGGSEPARHDESVHPTGDAISQEAGDGAEWDSPSQTADRGKAGTEIPPDAQAVAESQTGNPLTKLDKSSLKDWVERPLFAPSRKRPPVVAAQNQNQAAKPLPMYELLGVIRDSGQATALLRKKDDGTSFRVQVGDTLGGWQVSKVAPRAVTLVRGDGTSETVSLFRE